MIVTDPYNIALSGWLGVPVPFTATIYSVPPNPDGSGGTVQDISLWIFMFTLKAIPDDADAIAIWQHDFQIGPSPSGANGIASWTIPDTVMSTLTQQQTYYWDEKYITPASGVPAELMGGTLGIRRTITRRIVPVL
jgi:hypothetical protein